jgi:hypothetical protein
LGEEAVIGGPILKLQPAGGQQASHGVPSQAKQAAQREGLRALGDALLGEGGEAIEPELLDGGEDAGRVFLERKVADGGDGERGGSCPQWTTRRFHHE